MAWRKYSHPPTYCKTEFGLKVEVIGIIEGESNFDDFEKELTMLERKQWNAANCCKREENLRDSNKLETQIRFCTMSIEFHTTVGSFL